jgi:arylsulfatase A-like enzyme
MLELTGAKAPPAAQVLDGVSYLGLLRGEKSTLGRDALYWHFPGYLGAGPGSWRTTPAGAIRAGDYKLIEFFEDGRKELYNLKNDIGERQDLATKLPEKVKELHEKLAAWRQSVGAKMPTPNKPQKPSAKRNRGDGNDE